MIQSNPLFLSKRFFSMMVFDRSMKSIQRNRSVILPGSEEYDYIRKHASTSLVDRIEDINREFPLALDLGCHAGHIYKLVSEKESLTGNNGGIGGIKTLVQCDMSKNALLRAQAEASILPKLQRERVKVHYIQADEEKLEEHFSPNTFDLIMSNLCLHWVNDLPHTMKTIRTLLKLRSCLLLAEQERVGGMSVHTSPLAQVSDCGNLLSLAGFAIPTVDQDTFEVEYPDAFTLMEHIQRMGENNSALAMRSHVGRETFLAAASIYQNIYRTKDENITATFQIIYMIGWAPHTSQPQPKARGSAGKSLKELQV